MKKILAALVASAALAACGGDAGGSNSLTGTVSGVGVANSKETMSTVVQASCPDGQGGTTSGKLIVVVTSDQSGTCAAAQNNAARKNASGLLLTVGKLSQTQSVPDVTPGTYNIGYSQSNSVFTVAAAQVNKTDASCNEVTSTSADSGTITISSVSGNAVSGSVSLVFGSDKVTGTFQGTACTLPSSVTSSFCSGSTTNSCQ